MILNIYKYSLDKTIDEINRLSRDYLQDVEFMRGRTLIEIFDYVKNIQYVPDPAGVEFVMRPLRLIQRGRGDCDDKAVFINACMLINNIKAGYSIVSQSMTRGFHHIFNFIIVDGKRLDFDTTYQTNIPFKSKIWAKRKDYIL